MSNVEYTLNIDTLTNYVLKNIGDPCKVFMGIPYNEITNKYMILRMFRLQRFKYIDTVIYNDINLFGKTYRRYINVFNYLSPNYIKIKFINNRYLEIFGLFTDEPLIHLTNPDNISLDPYVKSNPFELDSYISESSKIDFGLKFSFVEKLLKIETLYILKNKIEEHKVKEIKFVNGEFIKSYVESISFSESESIDNLTDEIYDTYKDDKIEISLNDINKFIVIDEKKVFNALDYYCKKLTKDLIELQEYNISMLDKPIDKNLDEFDRLVNSRYIKNNINKIERVILYFNNESKLDYKLTDETYCSDFLIHNLKIDVDDILKAKSIDDIYRLMNLSDSDCKTKKDKIMKALNLFKNSSYKFFNILTPYNEINEEFALNIIKSLSIMQEYKFINAKFYVKTNFNSYRIKNTLKLKSIPISTKKIEFSKHYGVKVVYKGSSIKYVDFDKLFDEYKKEVSKNILSSI